MNNRLEIVISRFNEDLKWTTTGIFNNFTYIVYNKGDNDNFEKSNINKIINLKNVGRCDHTYLYHIINNYNNLSDITLFLPGSLDLPEKNFRATQILYSIKQNPNAVFFGEYCENIQQKFKDFCLSFWKSSNIQNFNKNNEVALHLSEIRPFGEWYKYNFENIISNYVSYWGIFSVDKKDIIQHPLSRYINLINQLETSSNPEVGHYIERSWNAIFYPMLHTKIYTETI
jgi:hypothetical protein